MTDAIKELPIWPKKEGWLFHDQYVIPLYQRPYEWSFENEIRSLLDDINGFGSKNYRLGVLSVIAKEESGKKEWEVVDGQQRLTTLYLLLKALSDSILSTEDKKLFEDAKDLTFENRKISSDTLKNLKKEGSDKDIDLSIHDGFRQICDWIEGLSDEDKGKFQDKLKRVSVYRIPLPEKTDPCKYFVRMNARGKQLELVDVLKAKLMSKLEKKEDREFFAHIWEACSSMDRYIQKTIDIEICDAVFKNWKNGLPLTTEQKAKLEKGLKREENSSNDDVNLKSIINFPTFLMHVLKLCALNNNNKVVAATDDKRLIKYFEDNWGKDNKKKNNKKKSNWEFAFNNPFRDRTSIEVREFLYTLFHARYLFDGWIVRGKQEGEEFVGWTIQHLDKKEDKFVDSFEPSNEKGQKEYEKTSKKIEMLQSCLRVTYSSPSSMSWITGLLKKLWDLSYAAFRSKNPNNYGVEVLGFLEEYSCKRVAEERKGVKGDNGYKDASKGTATPRILFNFLDYLLWRDRKWADDISEENVVKKGLKNFKFSYLSSVEHWFPQNPKERKPWDEVDQFGNLFLIGGGENSSLSNESLNGKRKKIEEWVENGINISLKGLCMYAKTTGDEETWKKIICKELGEEHYQRLVNEIKTWNLG